jgi:hypothetical protein
MKGEKGKEKSCWKSGADERIFIPGQGLGLVDEASLGAIPEAAAGECGHGTAKPNGVIHRYKAQEKGRREERGFRELLKK